jgi:hypothetical protein
LHVTFVPRPVGFAIGISAELQVDGSYVGLQPLVVIPPGATDPVEVVVPYDDEGGDELALVLSAFALEDSETVELSRG